jgi:hypothetical protein
LGGTDEKLLARVVAVADALTKRMIHALEPRLLLVHFSLAEQPRLDRVHLARCQSVGSAKARVSTTP